MSILADRETPDETDGESAVEAVALEAAEPSVLRVPWQPGASRRCDASALEDVWV